MNVRNQRGRGQGVLSPTPPEKSHNYRVSQQYWSGSPDNLQSYQDSIRRFYVGESSARKQDAVFKWRFDGAPMMAQLNYIGIPSPSKKKTK